MLVGPAVVVVGALLLVAVGGEKVEVGSVVGATEVIVIDACEEGADVIVVLATVDEGMPVVFAVFAWSVVVVVAAVVFDGKFVVTSIVVAGFCVVFGLDACVVASTAGFGSDELLPIGEVRSSLEPSSADWAAKRSSICASLPEVGKEECSFLATTSTNTTAGTSSLVCRCLSEMTDGEFKLSLSSKRTFDASNSSSTSLNGASPLS